MIATFRAFALLASLAAGPEDPPRLPLSLADDETELRGDEESRPLQDGGIDLATALQSGVQRPSGPTRPLFGRVEGDLFAGAVMFDSTFEAGIDGCGGVLLRVPTPWFPTGNFGIFAEGLVAHISRDAPGVSNTSGMFYGFGGGVDYTILRQENWWLMAQAGGTYLMFNKISEAQDGFGALVGVMAGIHLMRRETRYSFTLNPQFAWDGNDWILFANVGFLMRF